MNQRRHKFYDDAFEQIGLLKWMLREEDPAFLTYLVEQFEEHYLAVAQRVGTLGLAFLGLTMAGWCLACGLSFSIGWILAPACAWCASFGVSLFYFSRRHALAIHAVRRLILHAAA